jgi:ribosomal protein S11
MHQSSSTTKRQKKRKYIYKQIFYLKNYYDKTTFKVKDENGKVIADKKYADLTVKEKT